MTKGNAIRYYRKFTGADAYILGFLHAHALWMIEVEELMPRWMIMKEASEKHAEKLQMDLKAKHKKELIKKGAVQVCSEEEFLAMNDIHNKGFTFERLVFQLNGQGEEWTRDNVRFDKCGDIRVNETEYQVKFQNAQIVTVDTLHKIQLEKRD